LVAGREAAYHVLLVDLDEGFRVMASAEDGAEDYPIGLRVVGRFDAPEDGASEPRLVFAKESD